MTTCLTKSDNSNKHKDPGCCSLLDPTDNIGNVFTAPLLLLELESEAQCCGSASRDPESVIHPPALLHLVELKSRSQKHALIMKRYEPLHCNLKRREANERLPWKCEMNHGKKIVSCYF